MTPDIKQLDVSDLPAPEPLEKVLELLASSAKNEIICMIHRTTPCSLFSILKDRGYAFKVVEKGKQILVYIWNSENECAQNIIEEELKRVQ